MPSNSSTNYQNYQSYSNNPYQQQSISRNTRSYYNPSNNNDTMNNNNNNQYQQSYIKMDQTSYGSSSATTAHNQQIQKNILVSKLQSKAINEELKMININNQFESTSSNVVDSIRGQRQINLNDEKYTNNSCSSSAMTNERNFVKRGNLNGPVFDVDHLATFTVGSKAGLLKAEDGMRKLRIMEKSQGIWTMECQLLIDNNYLVVLDKKNGQVVEMFPLSLVVDPTSVVSDDKKDIYNNILLFTVLEDMNKKSMSTPSEMHIFQCIRTHSAEIVDEIYRAKEGKRGHSNNTRKVPKDTLDSGTATRKYNSQIDENNNNNSRSLNRQKGYSSNMDLPPPPSPTLNHRSNTTEPAATSSTTSRIEMEVQILNHCFDDIERFVTRLQNSSEYFKERKSHKSKQQDSSMLSVKAQMPPPQQVVDIFQKFKYSFNLLAKLKAHIHDPNAPELVHFLFTPLSLIVNATKEQPYRGLAKTVWMPLLTKDSKELLLNCLTSKEQDLWLSLGDAWTVTYEDVRAQPQHYSDLDINQSYQPVFYDGWSPNYNFNPVAPIINNNTNINPTSDSSNRNEINRLAFATAAQVQAQSQSYQSKQLLSHQPPPPPPPQSSSTQNKRYYSNTQPQMDNEYPISHHMNTTVNNNTNHNVSMHAMPPPSSGNSLSKTRPISAQQNKNIEQSRMNNIRNYDEMKKWAIDLSYRGAKVYEVTHDRQANNDKELTVKAGELLEVLDDKRNWWRLRNFYGNVGHAPVTILREFASSSSLMSAQPAHSQQIDDKTFIKSSSKINSSNLNQSSRSTTDSLSALKLNDYSINYESSDSELIQIRPSKLVQLSKTPLTPPLTPKLVLTSKPSTNANLNKEFNMNGFNNQNSNYLESNSKKESITKMQHDEDIIISPATSIEDFEPIRNELRSQLDKKFNPKLAGSNKKKNVSIKANSTSEDVKKFLTAREFSQKIILVFGELDGIQIFSLSKEDFEKYCGKDEGCRLFSQISIQKSICGYKDESSELDEVLRKRKQKTDELLTHF